VGGVPRVTQYDNYTDMNGRTRLGTHLVFEALGKMDQTVIDAVKARGMGPLIVDLKINGVDVDFQGFVDTLGRVVEEKVASRVQRLVENELNEALLVANSFVNDFEILLKSARANIRRDVVARVKMVVPGAEFEEEES
jgi:hypothetical protein